MKLISLLKSLQPEEFKEFEKFLQSPFFKVSDQYLTFFKCLCKRDPSFNFKKTDLEVAYRDCFGPKSLNKPSKLYNLMSGLSKQLEQFIVVRMVLNPEGQKQERQFQQLLVTSLGIRNGGAYFRTKAQQLIDDTVAKSVLEIDDYLAIQQVHYEIYYNPDTSKLPEHTPHLQLAAQHLDLYYCMAKLRYIAELKTRERIYGIPPDLSLLDAVMEHSISTGLTDAHPLLNIYHHLVNLYVKGIEEEGFRAFMVVFNDIFHLLNRVDQGEVLRHLINCGIYLVNRNCPVRVELLSLYKLAIKANLLLNGGRITHFSFNNIVNLASSQKEFAWVASFIDQFGPFLEESKSQATIDMAKASLYYSQGQLDRAQTCLSAEIFQTVGLDFMGRELLIKIAFDRYILLSKDYDFLIAQLNSYERYIPLQPVSLEKRKAELNWVKFVRKMAVLKFDLVEVPEPKKALLRKKLKPLQPVVLKAWLEDKIEVL